jgi:hypothetical protein
MTERLRDSTKAGLEQEAVATEALILCAMYPHACLCETGDVLCRTEERRVKVDFLHMEALRAKKEVKRSKFWNLCFYLLMPSILLPTCEQNAVTKKLTSLFVHKLAMDWVQESDFKKSNPSWWMCKIERTPFHGIFSNLQHVANERVFS